MKILIVTSQITYMPENYNSLILGLIQEALNMNIEVSGLVSLRTLDKKLLKNLIALPLLGVNQLTIQLIKNISSLLFKEREKFCLKNNVPYFNWDSMNSNGALEYIRINEVDLIINIRTRCIYKNDILKSPKLGCINVHHGILPNHRGTFCDLYALAENRPAGFSIHKMSEKVDDGEILKVCEVSKGNQKNYIKYLRSTTELELLHLSALLKEIKNTGNLPIGIPNFSSEIQYSKNPTSIQIKEFKNKGMII